LQIEIRQDYIEGGKKGKMKEFVCEITPSNKRHSIIKAVAWFLPAQKQGRRLDPSFAM